MYPYIYICVYVCEEDMAADEELARRLQAEEERAGARLAALASGSRGGAGYTAYHENIYTYERSSGLIVLKK